MADDNEDFFNRLYDDIRREREVERNIIHYLFGVTGKFYPWAPRTNNQDVRGFKESVNEGRFKSEGFIENDTIDTKIELTKEGKQDYEYLMKKTPLKNATEAYYVGFAVMLETEHGGLEKQVRKNLRSLTTGVYPDGEKIDGKGRVNVKLTPGGFMYHLAGIEYGMESKKEELHEQLASLTEIHKDYENNIVHVVADTKKPVSFYQIIHNTHKESTRQN